VCTIFIPIYSLQETVFSKTIYAFLCYKFSITITRILVKIEIFNNNIVVIKNEYLTYNSNEIKKDLKLLKRNINTNSGVEIDFNTDKGGNNNTIGV
jgi:hypothetical protein